MDGVLVCKIIGLKIRSCKTIDESQLTLPLPPTRNAQLNVALLKKGFPLERLALFQKNHPIWQRDPSLRKVVSLGKSLSLRLFSIKSLTRDWEVPEVQYKTKLVNYNDFGKRYNPPNPLNFLKPNHMIICRSYYRKDNQDKEIFFQVVQAAISKTRKILQKTCSDRFYFGSIVHC